MNKKYISTEFNCGRISVIVDLAEFTFSRWQVPCEKDYNVTQFTNTAKM